MIQNILGRLLAPAPERLPEPDARVALAALLVRVARADGQYDAAEIARIDRVLAQHHGLSPFQAAGLRTEAEVLEASAPDTVRFTRALKAATDLEDRAAMMQALWSVALADNTRDAEEDTLLRLVADLLGLRDVDSALARQRAAKE
ncbi:tellurite resistance TerB family protein [Pseudotabrizicola sp. L79]|uniref:tellurite resistance TerB family protein n=1 Tax=Pseudotabrizicola sp. L79 TaxID=3118402 RepID=UPI002F93E8C3